MDSLARNLGEGNQEVRVFGSEDAAKPRRRWQPASSEVSQYRTFGLCYKCGQNCHLYILVVDLLCV